MQHPGYFGFGLALLVVGLVQFLTRRVQGEYAYQTWKRLGVKPLIKSPEYWAKVSIPFNILFGILGLGFVISAFVA